jgi:hypothetical protein
MVDEIYGDLKKRRCAPCNQGAAPHLFTPAPSHLRTISKVCFFTGSSVTVLPVQDRYANPCDFMHTALTTFTLQCSAPYVEGLDSLKGATGIVRT